MPGRLSTNDANKILDQFFGKSAVPNVPDVYWLGLSLSLPHPTGTNINEPPGNGYARVQVPNTAAVWPTAANRNKANAAPFTFPQATGDGWGQIAWFVLMDAQTGGAMRGWGELNPVVTILGGETRSFPIGAIVVLAPV
jgi:hypothetical protein